MILHHHCCLAASAWLALDVACCVAACEAALMSVAVPVNEFKGNMDQTLAVCRLPEEDC